MRSPSYNLLYPLPGVLDYRRFGVLAIEVQPMHCPQVLLVVYCVLYHLVLDLPYLPSQRLYSSRLPGNKGVFIVGHQHHLLKTV